MPMPLEGLRVIDWTIWQQGPVASAMLGDLGAEVIKLESKDGGDPSFDQLGLARSGIMFAAGEPDMPPQPIGGGIADQMGAILLAYGVLAAVISRERYGVGQVVDASHLGSMSFLQGLSLTSRLINGAAFPRVPRARAFNPLWNHYRCGDDKWIALGMLQPDRYWADFTRAIGRPGLETDARFATMGARAGNCAALIEILDAVFASRPRAEWLDILRKGGDFIFTIVNSLNDLPDDPQMIANEYIREFDHPTHGPTKYVGIPVRLSETPGSIRAPAPEHGQHTELLLTELLGYGWDEVSGLRERGVI